MIAGHTGIYDLHIGEGFTRNIRFLTDSPRQFEDSLSAYFGVPYVFALDSGRSALLIALDVLGCSGREVLVNAYTTDVVHHSIVAAGAVPRMFDLKPETLEPDLDFVRGMKCANVGAIIHTGLFGLPCNPTGMLQEAQKLGIPLIEDACNSFGTRWQDKLCGRFGSLTILSFRVGKPLSSGGGALLTGDPALAAKIRERLKVVAESSYIRSMLELIRILGDYLAFQPQILKYVSRPIRTATRGTFLGKMLIRGGVADNAVMPQALSVRRMGRWQAALGLANLDEYQSRATLRRRVGRLIMERCRDLPLRFLANGDDEDWNGLFLPLLLPSDCVKAFVQSMRSSGFDVTRFHAEVTQRENKYFSLQEFPGTRSICDRLVCVPSTPAMIGQIARFHCVASAFLDKHASANN